MLKNQQLPWVLESDHSQIHYKHKDSLIILSICYLWEQANTQLKMSIQTYAFNKIVFIKKCWVFKCIYKLRRNKFLLWSFSYIFPWSTRSIFKILHRSSHARFFLRKIAQCCTFLTFKKPSKWRLEKISTF